MTTESTWNSRFFYWNENREFNIVPDYFGTMSQRHFKRRQMRAGGGVKKILV